MNAPLARLAALPEPLVKIDVVTGYDSDFAPHLTVMLLLLADTNFGHSFSVFVLWSGTPSRTAEAARSRGAYAGSGTFHRDQEGNTCGSGAPPDFF